MIAMKFLIIVSFAGHAFSEERIIGCHPASAKDPRIWKYSIKNEELSFWTLNSGKFYPFCSVGYQIQFPNGFLCAYQKDRKVGTIATFIDVHKMQVTDILIWEDTVLDDPNTWRQKSETPCKTIRN